MRQTKREIVQKLCYACHGSCLKCVGPFDYDCRGCDVDFVHTIVGPAEQYCIPTKNVNKLERFVTREDLIYYLIVVMAAIGMIAIFFCLVAVMKKLFFSTKIEKDYTYNQIETRDDSHNIATYYSDSDK